MKTTKHENSKKAAHSRAVFFDKIAKGIINLGGLGIIVAVLGILVFIVLEVLPLFYSPDVEETSELNKILKDKTRSVLLSGVDEYQEIAYVVTDSATVEFIDLKSNLLYSIHKFDELKNRQVFSASGDLSGKNFAIGLDSGFVATFTIEFRISFDEHEKRSIHPAVHFSNLIKIDSTCNNVLRIKYVVDEDDQPTIVVLAGEELVYYSVEKETSLFGDGESTEYYSYLSDKFNDTPAVFSIDSEGKQLIVSTTKGYTYYLDISVKDYPELVQEFVATHEKNNVTALNFLIGNQTVIIGDEKGNVTSWMRTTDKESNGGWKYMHSHQFSPHNSAITDISASSRNKTFITADDKGFVHIYYLTNENLLLELEGNNIPVKSISYAPKSNGAVVLLQNGVIKHFKIDNPHPETSLRTFFGELLYEGYKQPEYVWQSTGGTDSFEPKLSLIPLIFGTVKGTLYAMLFAVPLALLGALYTSTFSHPWLKNKIKPVVELMAALPSVVIGFLAGLWLAPVLEEILPGVFMMLFIMPAMVVLGVIMWKRIPAVYNKFGGGYEVILLIPFITLGVILSVQLGPWFETIFLGGDYRIWLSEVLNQNYDQRNSIVVGFAMGFAVIPLIFTICEDSLSNVPGHLTSASLALGASKWQTAVRVILPTASPGIFSAIMIGFGRAIGETMIVLMATGNTPILSMSPFNGMRTLSANIAVEIPEAPYQGTLYRILFISAALLFILTFLVNTVAEIVRQRLRKKYMHV